MKKYMVIDGNSIINRAFYALPPMNAPDGRPTNAIVGFISILQRLSAEEKPDGVCVCFDLHAPTFRHKMFEGYKGTRHPTPPELSSQITLLKEILDGMNMPRFELEGFEADDLLGTISREICGGGGSCVLVTGDRDSLQLVGGGTVLRYVSTGSKDTLYDALKIQFDFGISPEQFVDVKSLMGDASDNIPGVRGVGEKTAFSLIQTYGSLDRVYESLGELKPAVRTKLEAGRDSALMSRELARIDRRAPLAFSEDMLAPRPYDAAKLYPLLESLALRGVISKLGLERPEPEISEDACPEPIPALPGELPESFSVFPDGEDVYASDGERVFLLKNTTAGALRGGKTVWYSKPLIRAALDRGDPPERFEFDVMLAAYLLGLPQELTALSARVTGSAGSGSAWSALALARLRPELERRLHEDGLDRVYYSIELPLAVVLARMERDGFAVDSAALTAFGDRLDGDINRLEGEIYGLAGREFNINSPKQLSELLFEQLALPSGKKTKTGYSTDIDVLKHLTAFHPIVGKILEYRGLAKLRSTYVDGLLRQISPDGRIHCNLNQTGTLTGRISSSEPNLQNIPVRSEPGSELRGMFSAGPGLLLADADYSQIELRVLAHVSGDELMQKAFSAGEDIHRATAALVNHIPPDEVTPRQRSAAKAVNFGIVYGISDFSLSDDIGSTRAEARRLIEGYLDNYSGVRGYMDATVAFAREHGYVATMFGRRRYIPDIKHSNFNLRKAAERIAYNTPIQGTAADIIKLAMVRVEERFAREGLKARLILQVHDELIAEAPEDEAERALSILREEMEGAAALSVPLPADGGVGRTWKEAKS